ncbi:MAG: exodeoxyribonuclease VII large subunit [Ponticaulis sp.]|nr:exodeoxyribonuclease VII large subunit [Ponticaulis sp.]|tara:strand:- start:4386 stop:5996 length:1611 start_codon:yes stop_codon:yes gene_type:complete
MADFFPADRPQNANLHEFSVSELAGSIKRTIESNFERVRVRGELGRVTIAKSGHMYADLKDDKAVINTIMWKGSVSQLPFRPEEGLEVVAEGKLSTYPGRSNYQLIADTMNPAGAGALMALLEERKKKLAAEGLFDSARKRALPTFPAVIGVVTSPTGAVIRDILHRIADRFPVHVLLWPALVQGERAAAQITAGIEGFNALPEGGSIPRPDVLIVARGGGSIEDLWPFNEEKVVRAAAASDIPLISAVGHETDTTLIDYASDRRAPTPTGAAEIAVPVRSELLQDTDSLGQRLMRALTQHTKRSGRDLQAIAARLPRPQALLEARQQRYDFAESRLTSGLQSAIMKKRGAFDQIGPRLRPQALRTSMGHLQAALDRSGKGLSTGLSRAAQKNQDQLSLLEKRLSSRGDVLLKSVRSTDDMDRLAERLSKAFARSMTVRTDRLNAASGLLEALSYQATLKRGYVVVRDAEGGVVRTREMAASQAALSLQFSDGELGVTPDIGTKPPPQSPPQPSPKSNAQPQPPKPKSRGEQGSLF